jgi:hypothetical protein
VFGSGTMGSSDSTPATNGGSPAAGGVGGALVDEVGDEAEAEVEATPDALSVVESRLRFFADCFLARERKGKRDVFLVLAFRRAGSTAVGSSSGCIN